MTPASEQADFVAFHIVQKMGERFAPGPSGKFGFFSGFPRKRLEKTLGQIVWIVEGDLRDGRRCYRLVGTYVPGRVVEQESYRVVEGPGEVFAPPIEVGDLPWFKELLVEQRNFSYGFSRIKSRAVRAALREALRMWGDSAEDWTRQFIEGTLRRVSMDRRERNAKARQACIAHYGTTCFVCGFDFALSYGELGAGFIEVHHLRPLAADADEREVDPVADLRPLCSNCHAMIHRQPEALAVDDLRNVLDAHRRNRHSSI